MGKGQRFRLKWKYQQPTVLSGFSTLLENGKFLDMTLAAGGQRLKAHRLVLSACSPYFEKLLTDKFDKHPVLMLKEEVKSEELEAIMDYMYKGEVNLSLDQVEGFLKVAKALQIKGLNEPDTLQKLTNKKRSPDDGECSVSSAPGSDKKQILKRRKLDNDACQASTSFDTQSLTQNITSPTAPSVNIKMKPVEPNTIETEPKNLAQHKDSQSMIDRDNLMDMQKNDRAKKTGLVGPLTSNEAKVGDVFLSAREVIDSRRNSKVMKIFIKKKGHKIRMSQHQLFL